MRNGARRWGSSKQGNARRAKPGRNTVAAKNLESKKKIHKHYVCIKEKALYTFSLQSSFHTGQRKNLRVRPLNVNTISSSM